ncbi:Ig-like domain-containing protein [Cocleimonas sp. KMM 6892]|uniref:Ig-like domain-containing protein n=1 Tax=unclassified Cocleimonas TaxID=2639732 RepID=UPI002DB7DDD9|nr:MULTISPECIES: Ig-like domain-containing protein [unclassified Cocleimonas]MEB8431619.1 Ig-like domain-containing protein [Cocleimonas sp. KMM 6892]MEC4713609.1 Ig-like domain-containing protein [Cocleimonas sp. KMM 6895]MEC4742940.1 Ig-like domain-containing protein [Cocleimonas sp. KMM 6896]
MRNKTTTYKWAYLPFVFSSAAILATQATAGPVAGSQQYQDAKQVNRANHEYVGGNTQIGFGITDEGDTDVEFNQVLSESDNHSTSAGLWAGYDLQGDEKGLLGRGAQINHNWVSRDASGRATRVNKVFAAYDRNEDDHEKATVGYGQENEHLFWEGHVSKGLSGRQNTRSNGVSDRAYAWGAGGSVGKFIPEANLRVRAGLDHEWSDKVGVGEKDARNTTLSAGIEKFFQGTGHSVSLDVAGSKQSGGYLDGGTDDTDVTGRLGYKYDFGGASIYQPDRRYRRVRVEVPGKATPPRYVQKQQFKRVPTYKTVPVYGKKTVKKPYKQLVKSTMELEGQTFFKLNSSKLIPSAQTRLKQIAAQIRKSGYKGSIRITGNTCGLGDPVYDQILSEKRAKAVKNFLIKNGFNPDHLVARGLGKGHPKYPRTPDQDFKNRRVDIEYVSEKQIYKTGYRTETQNVQTGTRQVATGFKNVPAGSKNVMIDNGKAGSPRVVWRTEAIPTSPAWIKRALHNNIKHDRNINTYETTEGSTLGNSNNGPVAVDDSTKVSCNGGPVTINALGNDSDADNDALSVIGFTQPANGTVTQVSNGVFEYTPNAGTCGIDDEFTYTISDGNGGTDTATVTVSVDAEVDDTVKAVNDSATTDQGQAVTIDVLDNDDADASITRIVTGPSNGTATIVNDQIVYTPNADFTGTDTLTYEVEDPNGNLATATVTITVNGPVDDSVNAANDTKNTGKDVPVTIDVLSNDDADATIVPGSLSTPTNGGTVSIVDGKVLYTPAAGYVGTDTFTYQVTDAAGNVDTATVTVTITETDTSVNAVNDARTTDKDTPIKINVLSNDDADAVLLPGSLSTPENGGTVSIVGGQVLYTPAAGYVGTDTFTYQVRDAAGNVDTATVTVTITETDTSVNAEDDSETTNKDEPVKINVLSNDDSDATIVPGSLSTPENGGTVSIVGGQVLYTPAAGYVGTDTFTYQVRDAAGNVATATVTVTIKETDTSVKADDDSDVTNKNTPVTIDVLNNDDTDATIKRIVSGPSNGTAEIVGGQIKYTPETGFVGTDSFTYEVKDAAGNTAIATVTVTVLETDKSVDAKNDVRTTDLNTPLTIDVLSNDDDDAELVPGSLSTPTKGGTVSIVGDEIKYTPATGFIGVETFTYQVKDAAGNTDIATVTVTVEGPANTAPIAKDDSATAACSAINIDVLNNDTDADADDVLSIIGVDGVSIGAMASIVGGMIVYTPNPDTCGKGGSDSFTYTISDGAGHTASATVDISLKGVTGGTINAEPDDVMTNQDTSVDIHPLRNDTGSGIKIIAVDAPKNGTVTFTGSKVTYTPNPGYTGSDSFWYDIVNTTGPNKGEGTAALIYVDVVEGCATGYKCN